MTEHISARIVVGATALLLACGSDPEPLRCVDDDPGPLTIEPVRVGRGSFAIDPYEVSTARYRAFLDAMSDDTARQPSECAWNDSFEPDSGCLAEDAARFASCGELPQVCVDWCDARAFCEWDGKRLCGHPDGGPEPFASRPEPFSREVAERSEWMFACSAGGVNSVLFGSLPLEEEIPRCHTSFCLETEPVDCVALEEVDARPECHSLERGYGDVFNLVGNVSEWVDSCEGSLGPDDACRTRGSSSTAGNHQCDWSGRGNRSTTSFALGIRCCADL